MPLESKAAYTNEVELKQLVRHELWRQRITHSHTRKISFTHHPNTLSHVIYPNPVQDMLGIRTSLANPQIQIVDSYGKIAGAYQNQHVIKTDHLPAGLYFLIIESKGRKEILKFVKR